MPAPAGSAPTSAPSPISSANRLPMPDRPKLSPVEYVAQFSPGASHAFEELRAAVLADGPLDNHTCELIVLGAFVTVGNEASFKVHARRLLRDQVPLAAL